MARRAEGDVVAIDQPVAEVLTAKATVELPSPFAGVVAVLHFGTGDVVPVGAVLVSVEDSSEGGDVVASAGSETGDDSSGNVLVGYGTRPERRRRRGSQAAADTSPSAPAPAAAAAAVPAAAVPPGGPVTPAGGDARPAVMSPVVRRLARELGVDLASADGTGPDGVITRADVERAAENQRSPRKSAASLVASAPNNQPTLRSPRSGSPSAARAGRWQSGSHTPAARSRKPPCGSTSTPPASSSQARLDAANADRSNRTGIASLAGPLLRPWPAALPAAQLDHRRRRDRAEPGDQSRLRRPDRARPRRPGRARGRAS